MKVLGIPLLRDEAHFEKNSVSLPSEIKPPKPVSSFIFFVAFNFNSFEERKNPAGAILAFLEAFPAREDPSQKYNLIVKSHAGTAEEMSNLQALAKNDTRVAFINRALSNSENIALHNYQDCYVSLHRSEGYGMNILESMGAGIPTIATNYSGNVDFFQSVPIYLNSCNFPVPYKLIELKENVGPYEKGNHWADPDHEYAVKAMIRVAQGSCTKQHRENLSTSVYSHFGEDAIGKRMKKLLFESYPDIVEKIDNFQL